MQDIEIFWHDYRYFPYERELAMREAAKLSAPVQLYETAFGLQGKGEVTKEQLEKLVYFRCYRWGDDFCSTLQHSLERATAQGNGVRKQVTRYSVHGLHEYKGKFNPQIARGVLNILGVNANSLVMDPFCGSGTTLVECVHGGIQAIGCDINPLAVYISNAKLLSLRIPAQDLEVTFQAVLSDLNSSIPLKESLKESLKQSLRQSLKSSKREQTTAQAQRSEYLQRWFDLEILTQLEQIRSLLLEKHPAHSQIFLALISDLIRDYSFQDPDDLRIRRRRSALPDKPLLTALREKIYAFLENLKKVQRVLGVLNHPSQAYLFDSRLLSSQSSNFPIQYQPDIAITSPPYATALPYIDTQRLSLIWLDLCSQQEMKRLDAMLTGSREFIQDQKGLWGDYLGENGRGLPPNVYEFCLTLQRAISPEDGFRRKAVPSLLYRYLSDMQDVFRGMARLLKQKAPFALVIGHNHTILGGRRFDMDTPDLLKEIAVACGWRHSESIPLQTYQRYGVHNANAVRGETLLILQRL